MNIDDLKNKWISISEDEKFILGKPNFTCARIASRIREMGIDCNHKAEEEQALVIFVMLQFYHEHGTDWVEKMNKFLNPETTTA